MAESNGKKALAQEILDLLCGELKGSDPSRRVERITEFCSDITGTMDPTGKHTEAEKGKPKPKKGKPVSK